MNEKCTAYHEAFDVLGGDWWGIALDYVFGFGM